MHIAATVVAEVCKAMDDAELPNVKVPKLLTTEEVGTLRVMEEPELVSAEIIVEEEWSKVTARAPPFVRTAFEDVTVATDPRTTLPIVLATVTVLRLEINDNAALLHTMLVKAPASARVAEFAAWSTVK
jgi:hypothetical protein